MLANFLLVLGESSYHNGRNAQAASSWFAAIDSTGAVRAFGRPDLLNGPGRPPSDSSYTHIWSAQAGYTVLSTEGEFSVFGHVPTDGTPPTGTGFFPESQDVVSNSRAWAYLGATGDIHCWGAASYGGTGCPSITGATSIVAASNGFCALGSTGTLHAWGGDSGAHNGMPTTAGWSKVFGGRQPYQVNFCALHSDGSLACWGSFADISNVPSGNDFTEVVFSHQAAAALRADGSIVAWGSGSFGGQGAPSDAGYVRIYSNNRAFAAMKADGTIACWGRSDWGGSNCPAGPGYVAPIVQTDAAFGVLSTDGSVYLWGDSNYGASNAPTTSGHTGLFANARVFVAISSTGTLHTTGTSSTSGTYQNYGNGQEPADDGYVRCFSFSNNDYGAFTCLKGDGTMSVFGRDSVTTGGALSFWPATATFTDSRQFFPLSYDGSYAPAPPSASPITSPSGASGDPHLTFAHGGKADFRGTDKGLYNFLSAKNVSLNVMTELADFRLRGVLVHGSFMTQAHVVATSRAGHTVHASYWAQKIGSLNKGWMNGTIDDQPAFSLGPKSKKHIDDITLLMDYSSLHVVTPEFEVVIAPKPVYDHVAGPTKRLDVQVKGLLPEAEFAVPPHGIIGQSWDADRIAVNGKQDIYPKAGEFTTNAMAEGAIEGVAKDYLMASRYATAYKYSRFGVNQALPRKVAELTGTHTAASSSSAAAASEIV